MPTIEGICACGTVRFRVTAAFESAGYCHCHRCQRRSGVPWSLNAVVQADAVSVIAGASSVRTWRPPTGLSKSFCGECGGHLYSGEPGAPSGVVGVRFGALLDDPGIEPSWRQWVSSAQPWVPIPDDGLPRYPEQRPK